MEDTSYDLADIDSNEFKFEYTISDLSFPSLQSECENSNENILRKSLEVRSTKRMKMEQKNTARKDSENFITKIDKVDIPTKSYTPFEYRKAHAITGILSEMGIRKYFYEIFKKEKIASVNIFNYFHFKYSVLHLRIYNENIDIDEIKRMIEKRKKSEYSIFRRIYEGDEISMRNFTFQIVRINQREKYLILFDGFFEQKFIYNKIFEREIISQKLQILQKICLFSPIFFKRESFSESYFQINYNSYRLCNYAKKIGINNEISFIKSFPELNKDGGLVSAINVKIIKICGQYVNMRYKHLKRVVDYANMIKYEKEVEIFQNLIKKHNENIEEINYSKYYNLIVEDIISKRQGLLIISKKNLELKVDYELLLLNIEIAHPSIGFGNGEYHKFNIGIRFYANEKSWCIIK